jgi:glycosyltransferase involved in cell wall biosynthesis
MPKISIIVPVFKVEKYLPKCIDSLINQTLKDIEIILINDGSPDKCGIICDNYAKKDNRVIVIHQENQGVSVARNAGIEVARGEWITFVDGDDWVENNMCELALNKAQESEADIVIWSFFKNFINKEERIALIPGGDADLSKNKDLIQLKSIYQSYYDKVLTSTVSAGVTWCKLYNAEFIRKYKLRFKKGLIRAQDTVFSINAIERASKIIYFDIPLYHYRITDSSTCSGTKYIENSIEPFNSLLNEFMNFINYYNKGTNYMDAFYARTIQVLMWHIKHNYFHKSKKTNIVARREQISKLIKTEPYSTALNNVNVMMLPKKERLMTRMFKCGLIIAFYSIYKLYTFYESNRSIKYE